MIEYSNEGWQIAVFFQREGSVVPLSLQHMVPSLIIAIILQTLREAFPDQFNMGETAIKASQLYGAMGATLAFLIGFRTNKAYARFWDATTLLHQMWGEWFDASSCLVAFSSLARETKPVEVEDFRHTLVRLMSLMHASALDEIAGRTDNPEGYPTLDLAGLDQGTLKYLKDCRWQPNMAFNRVEVIVHMIQTLIVHQADSGVIKIPPPILSRVFQTLSRGQVNLANCKKITSTLFPFPYAQLICHLLLVFSLATPFVMVGACPHLLWGCIFTAIPVFGLFALNNVARQLEMPFGADPNDLPLLEFQEHMNLSLLMLIRHEADLVPHTSGRCQKDYDALRNTQSTKRPKDFIENEEEAAKIVKRNSLTNAQLRCLLEPKAPPEPQRTPEVSITDKAQAGWPPAPPSVQVAPLPVSIPMMHKASASTVASTAKLDEALTPPHAETALERTVRECSEELSYKFQDLQRNMSQLCSELNSNTEAVLRIAENTKDASKPQASVSQRHGPPWRSPGSMYLCLSSPTVETQPV